VCKLFTVYRVNLGTKYVPIQDRMRLNFNTI
jgi:hypothetical protein